MIIRHLREDEAWKPEHLMGCCFNYSVNKDEIIKSGKKLKTYWFGAFKDDGETLMSAFDVTNFTSFYCGEKIGCGGIGGVCTYPEYRRGGHIRALFGSMLSECREKGWDISVLFPFSFRYYRKFGYEVMMQHRSIVIPMKALEKFPRNSDGVMYNGEPEILEQILEVYNKYASERNICTFRSDGKYYPSDPVKEQKYTFLWYENGKPVSYATVKKTENNVMEISELIYTSPSSVAGILGFLRCYDGAFNMFRVPFMEYDSPVPFVIGEDWDLEPGTFYGVQARVVNFKKIFSLNKYPEEKGKISIKLYGDILEENNGVYEIEYENGKGNVNFVKDGKYDVSLPVHSMSRLLLGACADYTIPYLDGIESKIGFEKLAKCFPKRPINMIERC